MGQVQAGLDRPVLVPHLLNNRAVAYRLPALICSWSSQERWVGTISSALAQLRPAMSLPLS